jgi:hypothetical protein
MTKTLILYALCALCGSTAFAQNYQCDWSVVDMGGGLMTSASYRTTSSVGQTAIGPVASTNYQAFLGFWQIDTAPSGIREKELRSRSGALASALYAQLPNPFRGTAQVTYSLAVEGHVCLDVLDATGRTVTSLVSGRQRPGVYRIRWDPTRLPRRAVSGGIYFIRLQAGGFASTHKLVRLD